MIIKGVICSNLGRAHINILLQSPYMSALPHIKELHPGTINLNIAPQTFFLKKSAYHFPDIDWGKKVESFDFVPITALMFKGKTIPVRGYLYLPTKSPNRQGREVLEIWTTRMEGMTVGKELSVEIPEGYIEVSG